MQYCQCSPEVSILCHFCLGFRNRNWDEIQHLSTLTFSGASCQKILIPGEQAHQNKKSASDFSVLPATSIYWALILRNKQLVIIITIIIIITSISIITPSSWFWLQFSSVPQSCPTLYDPMNCSTPGLPAAAAAAAKLLRSCLTLCNPIDDTHQAPPSLGFSRQEYWSGLPFPSPMHESESEVAQSCLTPRDPMDCSLPGSSIHGIFQARVLDWVAIAFSPRPPCPSLIPRVHKNSCPSSRWCHPAISSSVVPFSSCPQSFPASESFPMSQLFTWSGQSIGVSALASFLPKTPRTDLL